MASRLGAWLLAGTTLGAALIVPSLAPAQNASRFPNIFNAFERNADGVEILAEPSEVFTLDDEGMAAQARVTRLVEPERVTTLWGEFDHMSMPFFMTSADMSSPVIINIAFQNAASVMPEASRLTVLVNGQRVGETAIQSPTRIGTLRVEVPMSVLALGHNALTLTARQHHRVDCTAAATYELWTRIDMSRTTIEYGGDVRRIRSMRDLAGFPIDENSALPVNLHFTPGEPFNPWGDKARTYFDMVQKAMIIRDTKYASINVVDQPERDTSRPALDVFAGTIDEVMGHPVLGRHYDFSRLSTEASASQGRVMFVTSRNGSRVLMLTAPELQARPDAFNQIMQEPPIGSPNAVQLLQRRAAIPLEQTTVSLRELGYIEQEFAGRRFQTEIGFTLPAEFYPAAYDHISLHLFGLYTGGLKPGQTMLIKINGQSEVSMPLSGRRGGLFENRIVELPLSRFKPGYNEVEIEAFLEKPIDDTCVPGNTVDRESRFFLSGDTFLAVPKLAHWGRFPNVGATVTTGFPYRPEDGRGPLEVMVSDQEPATFGKAITFVSGLAAKTGRVYQIVPAVGSSSGDMGGNSINRLVVGRFDKLPVQYAQSIAGADMVAMASYWASPSNALAAGAIDGIRTSALSDPSGSPAAQSIDPQSSAVPSGSAFDMLPGVNLGGGSSDMGAPSLRERFQQRARNQRDSGFFEGLTRRVTNFFTWPAKIMMGEEVVNVRLPTTTAAVVSQLHESDGRVTTIVGYAESGNRSADVNGFFTPGLYDTDLIQTAGMELSDERVTNVPAGGVKLNTLRDYSFSNLRLIMAGWLSNNPSFYGTLSVIAFIILGFISTLVLQTTQRTFGEVFEPND